MPNKALPTLCVAVATLTFAVGCLPTVPYSAPQSFTVSKDTVTKLVQDAIAGDVDATKIVGSPVVNCDGDTSCTISYAVQEPAGSLFGSDDDAADRQLILPTRQMWKALFTDPQFQRGTITVSGQVTTLGEKSPGPYYTLTCDRSAAAQIDWNDVEGKGLRTLCDYAQMGLPSYTGPAPPPSGGDAAEQQFQADIQAHGVPAPIRAIPGLGQGACDSVRNVETPGQWAMQMANPPENWTLMQSLVVVYWAIKDLCPDQMDKGVRDFWKNEIYDHRPAG